MVRSVQNLSTKRTPYFILGDLKAIKMTDPTTLYRHRVVLLWLTTGLGGLVYATIQSFTYVNGYIAGHGATPALIFDASALWVFAVLYAIWIIPPLLAIASRTTLANWVILLVGGFLVIGSTFGGIFDGFRDGGHIIATALIAITLPGVFALRATWGLLRTQAKSEGPLPH